MLRIWGRDSSGNVKKVLWCADELGLAYERVDVGGEFGGLDTPEYRALNPNGLVPTLEEDGFVLWEANSIVRYLCAHHGAGALWPQDARERANLERWMDWQSCHLVPEFFKMFIALVRTPEAERDPPVIEHARRETERHFRMLDGFLDGRDYVGGERFTMGDIPVGCTVYRWYALPIERPELPHLAAWYARLCERPAYRHRVMQPLR